MEAEKPRDRNRLRKTSQWNASGHTEETRNEGGGGERDRHGHEQVKLRSSVGAGCLSTLWWTKRNLGEVAYDG